MGKRHNNFVFSRFRRNRFYAVIFMIMLIAISVISSDIDITKFTINNTDHKVNFASYQPTNPPADLYTSSDGNNFAFFSSDEKYSSKQVQSTIKENNGVFFIAVKPIKDRTYYVAPQVLTLKDGSCINGFDFIDISGTGVKQWVFKCDLKNAAIIFTLFAIPLSMINELFDEIGNNIPARYSVPILRQKRLVIILLYYIGMKKSIIQ